jgi:hypothetical protein
MNHEDTAAATAECPVEHLQDHLQWQPEFADAVLGRAQRGELVKQCDGQLALTGSDSHLVRGSSDYSSPQKDPTCSI